MAEHTKTPWTRSCFQVYGSDKSRIAHTGMGQLPPYRSTESEANAALIVKAVNEHAELVQTRATFLGYLQAENGCKRNGRACREKCGCDLELQELVAAFSAPVGGTRHD